MENNAIILDSYCLRQIVSDGNAELTEGNYCHDCFEIAYYRTEGSSITVEGNQFSPKSGSVILINPFAYHKVRYSEGVHNEIWSIQFSKSSLPENIARLFDGILGDGDNSGMFFGAESLDRAADIFDRFLVAKDLPDEKKGIFADALLSELIILLSVAGGDSISHEGECLGARVMRFLNRNIERNISLDRLAKHFFVSKYHLCRAFKDYSGISVHSYINHKRIMYARQLIESGETASHAAEKVGFGDYSAFYRAYIKILGKSPTAEQREGEDEL